jgi:hypothetical protein
MADASACRIGHDSQRTGWHPASRVRFAGLRPPVTPAASSNTTESTHSKFRRGINEEVLRFEIESAVRPNVRAKLAPTVGRAGQVGENVQGTAGLARVARRWGST